MQIDSLQEENKAVKMKLTKQTKSKERLALELKKNKQKMDAICDMEKKIEKYEFVLNIEKYKKVN